MKKNLLFAVMITMGGVFIFGQGARAAAPTVTAENISIYGANGNSGEYIIDDLAVAEWDNSASGDNNVGVITGVTVDFSQFEGGAAVEAFDDGGADSDSCDDTADDDIWTSCEDIIAGSIDGDSGINVSVTATNGDGPTTVTDDTDATVDNVAPVDPTVLDYTDPIDETNVDNFSFNGTTDPNETVYWDMYDEGSGFIPGSEIADGSGFFTVSGVDASSLSDGEVYLYVWIIDTAGNSSASEFVEITIDKDTSIPSIQVNSPNGGETWHVGETYNVTWTASEVDNVKIYIYDSNIEGSGGTNYITPNGDSVSGSSGSYSWAITEQQLPVLPGSNYRIRIDAVDGDGNVLVSSEDEDIRDFSNAVFTINSDDDDDKQGTKAERKKYKHYKGLYKNKLSKKYYLEIKSIKKENRAEFDRMKAIFVAHKHDKKAVLEKLDQKTKEFFFKYKNYNGYRNYKIYKEKVGK